MKIRVKFRKYGIMKFIGHLDMMRYFQKALRRAGIAVSYTGGFSPHIIMSFASPLGVGLTSDGEYMDIQVEEAASSADCVRRLNEVMAEGVEILSFREIPEEKSQNAMSLVAAADYEVRFRPGREPGIRQLKEGTATGKAEAAQCSWQEAFAAFLAQPGIVIRKKSKKSERELDIRPFIYEAETGEDRIFLRLSAGSVTNIKPELVMEAFYQYLGQPFDPFALLLHRKELYARREDSGGSGKFVSLEELGRDFG